MAHPKLWGTTDTRNGLPTTTKESPDFGHGECQENETSSDVFEEKKIRQYVDVLIRYGDLYDRQWDYVKDLIKRLQEKKNPKPTVSLPPVPCRRISIVGKVLNTKPNLVWGGLNMLVEMNEGWKIWGRVPNNLRREESFGIGAIVKFDVTVKKSDKDETFGFFSRPKNAKMLS